MSRSSSLPGLVLIAFVLSLGGCGSDENRLAELLETAEAYEKEEDWSAARIDLANALRIDPQSPEINLRLGRIEAALSNEADALFYYEEAYRLDPDNVAAATGIVGLVAGSDLERARTVVDEIRARQPSDSNVHLTAASLALVEEDVPAALVSALTALELDPQLAVAQIQLGLVYAADIRQRNLRKQEVPEDLFTNGLGAFRKALELAPDSGDQRLRAWTEIAAIYARWGGTYRPEVAKAFAEGFQDLSDHPEAQRELAKSSLGMARFLRYPDLIQWSLERTVEVDPTDYQAWGDLAKRAQAADGTGVAVLTRLIEEHPDDPRGHAMYARMLSIDGKADEAIAHLESTQATLTGDASPVLQRLIELQILQEDLETARATLEDMKDRYPDAGATYHASAQLALADGDLDAAVGLLERWNNIQENLIALRMLSNVELSRGNGEAALAAADRSLELADQGAYRTRPALCLRGRALVMLGQADTALRVLSQAQRSTGAYTKGCKEALVAALYETGRDPQARQVLEPLLAEDPPGRVAVMLFVTREGERNPERARALLEGRVAAHPEDARAHAQLVRLDQLAGDAEAALARSRKAAEAYPDSPDLALLLGRTLVTTDKLEEAVTVFENALERWPDVPETSAGFVNVLGRVGRIDEARETLEALNEAGDLRATGQVTLARLRLRADDEAGAIELLEAALAANPNMAAAANDLAFLLTNTGGDLDRARELAQTARGQEPKSAQIADTLGWVYLKRGLTDAALVQFDEAISLADPQSVAWATANFHRALALKDLDRKGEALEAIERAMASGTDFPEAEQAREAIQELAKEAS